MSITLRRYQPQDIQQCIVKLDEFFQENRDSSYENNQKALDFDKDKVYDVLSHYQDDPDFYFQLILDNEEVVGGLCAVISQPLFTEKKIAYDQIFYITPKFTNLKAVIRLIKHYTEWAERRGAFECRLCSSTGFKQQGFTMLCQRLGFQQFEIGFSRRM